MWVDDTEYTPSEICTLCDKPYGSSQAIFKTPCNHLFHNNCLNKYCEEYKNNECPVCGKDIGYSCTDVMAFKDKVLGNDKGPLFEGNDKILKIYNDQEGGKKRRSKKRRTKRNRNKRNRTKRNRNKRRFRVKK